jgi:amidohydrolase
MPTLEEQINADLSHIVDIRHDLHAHPELGYGEERTSGVVKRELAAAGIEFVGGLAKGTGVLGYLPATTPNARTIALRADMDALPIKEATGLAYASKHEGVMHACGHDGHTSIMIGTARLLSKTAERPNNVLFIFQPAEEGGAGGRAMCEDGVLAGSLIGKKADMIFGLHGFPGLHVGQMATRTGSMMASADEFRIHVKGKGGHAAMPHMGIDPIVAASHIVVALQSIASRNINPLDSIVVTIGEFTGGTAHNVIPDRVELHGTLRTLLPETRAYGEKRVTEIAIGVAAALGASAEVEFLGGYPVTCNDAEATDRFRRIVSETFETGLAPDTAPVMGAEDFSFYGDHAPACFYWLGILPPGQNGYANLHAPEFDFNDAAIPVGIRAMAALALSAE